MRCSKKLILFTMASLSLAATTIEAATIYREPTDGDLADFVEIAPWMSPGTSLDTLPAGASVVLGSYTGIAPRDSDVFTFEVPQGHVLNFIELDYAVVSGDPGGGSYIAIQQGTELGTGISTAGGNLSNALVNTGGNLLAVFEAGPTFGGLGLTAPLAAGHYTLGLHETGNAAINYSLTFNVSAVPEPATFAIGLIAMVSCVSLRRRSA